MTNIDSSYQPKHLNYYDDRTGHCCLGGCASRGCPEGCCVRMEQHKTNCLENPFRAMDEFIHAEYIDSGLRKHLLMDDTESSLPPPPPLPQRVLPDYDGLSTSASIYPDRFDYREQRLEAELADHSPLARWRRIVRRRRN